MIYNIILRYLYYIVQYSTITIQIIGKLLDVFKIFLRTLTTSKYTATVTCTEHIIDNYVPVINTQNYL